MTKIQRKKYMTLESSKNLGGIGAILLFVGAVGFLVEPLLAFAAIIGVILCLVALHGLADFYRERGIFNNALWAFLAIIVGIIVAIAALAYLVVYTDILSQFVQVLYPTWNGDWTTLPTTPQISPDNLNVSLLVPLLTPIIEIYVLFCIFLVITGFFIWRSLKKVSVKANVGLFGTAGILLFIGAILSILFIGLILMWIATLLMAIAFFQLRPQVEPPSTTMAPPALTPTPV